MSTNMFTPSPAWLGQADAIAQRPTNPSKTLTALRLLGRALALAVIWFHLIPAVAALLLFGPFALPTIAVVYGAAWRWSKPIRIADPIVLPASIVGRPGVGSSRWEWTYPASIPLTIPSYRDLVAWSYCSTLLFWRVVQWRRLCARAAVVLQTDRLPRAPRLLRAEVELDGMRPVRWRYWIRPLPAQLPESWGTLEARLLSVLDGVDSFHHPVKARPSRMLLTVLARPMPDTITVGVDRTLADLEAARELPGDIVLGESLHGGPIVLRPDEPGRSMLIFTGAQGSGKTNTVNGIILQAGLRGDRITVINPKRDGAYSWCQAFASVAASERLGWHLAVQDALVEMQRRATALRLCGLNNHLDLTDGQRAEFNVYGYQLVVLEEIATFVNSKGDPNRKLLFPDPHTGELVPTSEGQLYKNSMEGLGELFSMGRALGMMAIALPQHFIADNLGPNGFGSTLKANVNCRMAVGRIEPEAMRIAFGAGTLTNRQASSLSTLHHGHTIYSGLTNADDAETAAKSGQLFFYPPDLLASAAEGLVADGVTDFDDQAIGLVAATDQFRKANQ